MRLRTGAHVGVNVPVETLRRDFDAVVLAGGASRPRDLPIPGRELGRHPLRDGVPDPAEPALRGRSTSPTSGSSAAGASASSSSAAATRAPTAWARCTARARASSTSSSCCHGRPTSARPTIRGPSGPTSSACPSAHEEGGERVYSVSTQRFVGDDRGRVKALTAIKVDVVREGGRLEFKPVPGSDFELEADLVLLAMGFLGPERPGMLTDLGVKLDRARQRLARRELDDERARRVRAPATCSAASR